MYTEDQLLPLSAVSHYVHCPRRFSLLHIERIWEDNVFTAEGTVLHEKVDSGKGESRGDIRIVRSLRLRSMQLGVTGIADVVELHRTGETDGGVELPGVEGFWKPFPVEYKRGASKNLESFKAQLCAQALSLEELFGIGIQEGALFLGTKQRRYEVAFTDELKGYVVSACHAMQELFSSGVTPPAMYSKKCDSCSLVELCNPKSIGAGKYAKAWIHRNIKSALGKMPEDAKRSNTGSMIQ